MTPQEQQDIVDVAKALTLAQDILTDGLAKSNKPGSAPDITYLFAAYENAAIVLARHSLRAARLTMQFQTKEL